jgi:hypothetical protein
MRSVLAALALGYVAVASAFMSGVLATALLAMRVMMLVVFHSRCAFSAALCSPIQRHPRHAAEFRLDQPRQDEESLKVCQQLHMDFQCSK